MRLHWNGTRLSVGQVGWSRSIRLALGFAGATILLAAANAVASDRVDQPSTESGNPAESSPSEWVEDGWKISDDEKTRVRIRTRPLTLHLRDEPRPALTHQFFPRRMVDGNAAIYYLKAMGFLEQQNAQAAIAKMQKQWFEAAQEAGESTFKPSVWLSSDPSEIDLAEAKEYLSLHSFQPRELRQAVIRKSFDLDRRIEEVEDPLSYLLPEIQTMRQLARVQSLRVRVALAENRIEDAMECLQQQFVLAAHLGQEPFLISNLVGVAIARIACDDMVHLLQHDAAPNLYWAIASLPHPLVDLTRAMEYERGMLYEQLKSLKEVDERPRSPEYWSDFLDTLAPQFGYFADELGIASGSGDQETVRSALVGFVVAGYPGAKRFLIEQMGMSTEQVSKYPPTQVVMLATVRYYDVARDDIFKNFHLPFWQSAAKSQGAIQEQIERDAKLYGLITEPTDKLLPVVTAVQGAQARCEQSIAALKTIEAIRVYAVRNDGRLPQSLDDLPLPAGIDPATGQLPEYEIDGDTALLTWGTIARQQDRFRLSITPSESD